MIMHKQGSPFERAIEVFRDHGGVMRAGQVLKSGVTIDTLYRMVDQGVLERLTRGLYALTDMPPIGNPDFVTVAMRIPHGVICLLSALSFHGLTTKIPHEVTIAVDRKVTIRQPKIDYPPVRLVAFSGKAFQAGIESHEIDEFPVRIYSREKSIADIFKYRTKIGLDVAREALRLYLESRQTNIDSLIEFARICRVETAIMPYLEALL